MNSLRFALSGKVLFLLHFWKTTFLDRALLVGSFLLLALWVCPWTEAKLLLVAGELMRHLPFIHDADVPPSCGWFTSKLPPAPAPLSLISSFTVDVPHVILNSSKSSVTFFFEVRFSGCAGSLQLRCLGFSLWRLLLMPSVGSRLLASVAVDRRIPCSAWGMCCLPWPGIEPVPRHEQADS